MEKKIPRFSKEPSMQRNVLRTIPDFRVALLILYKSLCRAVLMESPLDISETILLRLEYIFRSSLSIHLSSTGAPAC